MSPENRSFIEGLRKNGTITTEKIFEAFLCIDRKDFVPEQYCDLAYIDAPIPIGNKMTTSQPTTIAFMLEKLQPEISQKILEIGTGSGYLTALLAKIVGTGGRIVSVEYFAELKNFAESNLKKYDLQNVHLLKGDGKKGVPDEAPFDMIVSSAEVHKIPRAWKEQLKVGGKLLTPLDSQIALISKLSEKKFKKEEFPYFSFVKLK